MNFSIYVKHGQTVGKVLWCDIIDVFKWVKTLSTNNRINSKISQQHTPFVDCYCGREVSLEKVYLFVVHKFI